MALRLTYCVSKNVPVRYSNIKYHFPVKSKKIRASLKIDIFLVSGLNEAYRHGDNKAEDKK